MNFFLVLPVVVLGFATQAVFAQTLDSNVKPFVYKIRASACSAQDRRNLTGFLMPNAGGIVTALHGVVGCDNLRAMGDKGNDRNDDANVFRNLEIRKVDLANDVALLASTELDVFMRNDPGRGLTFSTAEVSEQTAIYVVGFPLDVRDSRTTRQIFIEDIKELEGMIPAAEIDAFRQCGGSPSINIYVLSLEGSLRPGESGAPVLNGDHQVVGVGMGGLDRGRINIVWASDWRNVKLVDAESLADELAQRAEQTCLTNRFASGGDIEAPVARAALENLTRDAAEKSLEKDGFETASMQLDGAFHKNSRVDEHLKEKADADKLEETVKRLQRALDEAKQQALGSLAAGNIEGAVAVLEQAARAPGQADLQSRSRDLLDLALLEEFNDADRAMRTLKEAVELDANNLDALFELGRLQVDAGQLDGGLETFGRLLARAAYLGEEEQVDVLNELGYLQLDLYDRSLDEAHLESAEKHLEQALNISLSLRYQEGEADALSALGFVHLERGEYAEARAIYERNLTVVRKMGDEESEIYVLYDLGDAHFELENDDQAFEYYQYALKISRKIGDSEAEILVLNNIGDSHFIRGEFDEALGHYSKALALSQHMDDSEGEGFQYLNLGDSYLQMGNIEKARNYYQDALIIFEVMDSPLKIEAREALAELE